MHAKARRLPGEGFCGVLERGRVIALGHYRAKRAKGRVMGIPFPHAWTVRAGWTIALDAMADCGCMPPA